jgi:hypothetical protein
MVCWVDVSYVLCFLCEQGKPWQFKEFPYKGADKGNMVETFSNIFGAFFHYKDEKVRGLDSWCDAPLTV